MDGDKVKAWEALCIEEQPPACIAACPLRVDARTMAEKMAAGDFTAAMALYARVVPFPAIIAHVCDHPCESVCRRAEAGGAVRLGALERALIEESYPTLRRQAQRARKPKTVAIVGAGLAGLTAAFDLVMKGHAVTVFEAEARPLERLRDTDPATLPPSAIEADLGALVSLGVDIRCRQRVGSLDKLIADHDAVLLAIGPGPATPFGDTLALTAAGRLALDPQTLASSHPKVFGSAVHDGETESYSAILSCRDGRRAATSIDRLLQGASLTANRADDTDAGTCLFVDTSQHAVAPPVEPVDAVAGYCHDEAQREASRCFPCHCLECVKACPYLAHYKTYPKRAVREIYNNDSIIMGNRKSNRMIDSCTLCGLCNELCPNDLAMGDVCLDARQSMVIRDHMPASHHDFALRDMAFSRSDEVAFVRHQPGHETSAVLFFPGCQLPASAPHQVEAVYRHLSEHIEGGVGFMLDCCGAPAHWSGRKALHGEVLDHLKVVWEQQGRPRIVTACSTCLQQITTFLPDLPVTSLWTELQAIGLPETAITRSIGPLAIHDPCTSRHARGVQAAVRSIATTLGAEVRELTGAEKTTCCGYGGLVSFANPEVGNAFVDRRIEESEDDYLAYCAMCRDNFARRGKRAVHLIDLIFPEGDDPAARPDPGFSGRRDNRLRLRRRLLRELWGESMSDPVSPVVLVISDAVRADIERKLLLVDDIAEVIAEAERSGQKLKDRTTGRLTASGRIGTMTTWVEYEPGEGGFIVHRAYGHRMQVEVKR